MQKHLHEKESKSDERSESTAMRTASVWVGGDMVTRV